jgi:hypothetical protein
MTKQHHDDTHALRLQIAHQSAPYIQFWLFELFKIVESASARLSLDMHACNSSWRQTYALINGTK